MPSSKHTKTQQSGRSSYTEDLSALDDLLKAKHDLFLKNADTWPWDKCVQELRDLVERARAAKEVPECKNGNPRTICYIVYSNLYDALVAFASDGAAQEGVAEVMSTVKRMMPALNNELEYRPMMEYGSGVLEAIKPYQEFETMYWYIGGATWCWPNYEAKLLFEDIDVDYMTWPQRKPEYGPRHTEAQLCEVV